MTLTVTLFSENNELTGSVYINPKDFINTPSMVTYPINDSGLLLSVKKVKHVCVIQDSIVTILSSKGEVFHFDCKNIVDLRTE